MRAVIDQFVDRVVSDLMIGFMFARVDRARLKRFEYQHAAEHLGGPVRYEGRPLSAAHRPHRIMGGQFLRRREVLRQVLVEHRVAADIRDRWLAHVDSLRGLVTVDAGSDCVG